MKVFVAVFMSVIMSHIPEVACAEASHQMIPTMVVVDQMSRAQAEEKVAEHVNRAEVRAELEKRGISPEEVSARVASLSDREVRQLATQMDEARYGSDVVGILVVVVLVLLIVFLVKRV